MVDKKWRISGKVSIVDILIVVVAVVCVYFGYRFIFASSAMKPKDTTPIAFTVEFRRQSEYLSGRVKVGDFAVDAIKGYSLGEVVKVEERPSFGETFSAEQGKFVLTTVPEFIDIYVTIKADASITEEFTMVGAYSVAVGNKATIKTADFAREGYIIGIEQPK